MNMIDITDVASYDFSKPETLVLDLANAKPKDLLTMKEAFEVINKSAVVGSLGMSSGWHKITPAMALELLKRNRPGANRKVDPATVYFYGRQMADGDWKATGQPVLFDRDGKLNDAQHRLWASVVSGSTFETYVITDIPVIENGFAYIDNNRPRNAAAALQTSGLNGVSSTIAKVVKLAEEIRCGVYDPSVGVERLQRLSPAETLRIAKSYPNAQDAAHSAHTDWSGAVALVNKKRRDVIAYLGMRIIDLYGPERADEFMEEIAFDDETRASDNPITALRKAVAKDETAPVWRRHHYLAALTKAFNAWVSGEPLKGRWMLMVDETFPTVEAPVSEQEAA